MSAYRKLNGRRKAFVDAYVRLGIGAEAYREVYGAEVKQAATLAHRLLAREDIAAAVAERETRAMEQAGITRTRTWLEVRRLAFFDHRKLVDEHGDPRQLHELDADTAAAIAGIDLEEIFAGSGEDRRSIGVLKKYRAWNKTEALKMILQAFGALVEKHEISVTDEGGLSELDRARRVALLLARGLALQGEQSESGNPAGVSPPAKSNQQESSP